VRTGDSPAGTWVPRVRRWRRLQAVALFFRLSAFGATAVMALFGAASNSPHLPAGAALSLLAIAACYHVFAYLLNDVVDLPIDRHEARRAISPLVLGTVRPGVALAIALASVPLGLAIAGLTPGGRRAAVSLAVSFALMAVYDLFGKRTRVPWVTDVVQGLAWATLLLCGAAVRGPWEPLTWMLFVFVTVYIVMANGVHGALRDLENDARQGARSVAIAMGARIDGDSRLVMPRSMTTYAWTLHAALVVLAFVPAALGEPPMARAARVVTVAALVVVSVLASRMAVDAVASPDPLIRRSAGTLHVVLMIALPAIAVLAPLDLAFKLLLVTVFALPLTVLGWFPDALRWAWRRRSSRPGMLSAPMGGD
jgi:4-hydroxybenzoate polyprenyltransferase